MGALTGGPYESCEWVESVCVWVCVWVCSQVDPMSRVSGYESVCVCGGCVHRWTL